MPTFTLYTEYILAVTEERTLFNLLLLLDLHSYFGVASSSKSVSASVGSSEDDSQSSDVESLEPHPPKNIVQLNPRRYRPNESITRNGKRISCG